MTVAERPHPDLRTPGGSLAGYLAAQRDRMRQTDAGVRAGDPDAVHDMRVAVRRLRATLSTFRPILPPAEVAALREELHWLGRLLGAVRDGDVLAARLSGAIGAEPRELIVGPVAARIHQRLAAQEAQARAALAQALDGPRLATLLDRLDTLVGAPAPAVSRKRLLRLAGKALRRADRQLDIARRLRAQPPRATSALTFDGALHNARRAYKRARYAVEVLEPVVGAPARRLANRLTVLQDLLGAHQDAVVAERVLRDYGMRAYLDGDNAFSYGLLLARQQDAGERQLARLARARRRAGTRRVRDWLS